MGLDTEQRQSVVYFTGYEVEHTICYDMFTLFVVGTPPLDEILKHAKEHKVAHIYFGTSQSYHPSDESMTHYPYKTISSKVWDTAIIGCLNAGYWVTLDYDVKYHSNVVNSGYNDYEKFIGMCSVKLPNIDKLNKNTTIKLDDTTWGDTNPGVWTHNLNDLKTKDTFTSWDQYTQDTDIG